MEVLGGVAAGLQVASLSIKVIKKLAEFVHDARGVVETNHRILNQVDNLIDTVRTVQDVMERRQAQTEARPLSKDELKAQNNIARTLERTIKTIDLLREKIEKLGGGKSQPGAWRRGWIQIKAQVQNEAIIQIEKQMDRNMKSLQLIIPCVQL